ncbi:MAG: hypothetical protein AABN33_18145 [Acidobacteriota bacterium]
MGILNREQLEHTQRQITKLELALEEMKRAESPRAYETMSQGFIAQIEQMRSEIDEYLGITATAFDAPEVVTR